MSEKIKKSTGNKRFHIKKERERERKRGILLEYGTPGGVKDDESGYRYMLVCMLCQRVGELKSNIL